MSFKRLDPEDISISAESVTRPVWSGNVTSLTTFFTSSVQAGSVGGDFYLDVYQTASELDNSATQFSIAYCDLVGSGSVDFTSGVEGYSPSSVNYKTYRTLTQGDEENPVFFNEVSSSYFFALNFERARFKEKLLPGTFSLTLSHSGNSIILKEIITPTVVFSDAGRVYDLKAIDNSSVERTVGSDIFIASGSYGKIFPDIGLILVNGQTLDAPVATGGLNTNIRNLVRVSNTDTSGSQLLYNSIVGGSSFTLNSEETISSNYIFVRARNQEFNYSSNPSYLTGSGELRHELLKDDPRAYFTSVGLYNDSNELLAVAKLSRPLLKDSRKEALVRIKLDF